MKNIQKARDWLSMAKDDYKKSKRRLEGREYSDAVHHAQQSAEKACKSLLSFMGLEVEKTHFPSRCISDILESPEQLKRLELEQGNISILVNVTRFSSSLEEQRSMPRYSWETHNRIITPDEIYDESLTRELVEDAKHVLTFVAKFYERHAPKDMRKLIDEVKSCTR